VAHPIKTAPASKGSIEQKYNVGGTLHLHGTPSNLVGQGTAQGHHDGGHKMRLAKVLSREAGWD
jgi:hypothetical protein